ncbi:uncharacterized protein LOC131210130 [Anopheles bellator]|uniref:uncharacterized protein LOC131210130 n=1 Tax=Anopheles bellator TaxID=139047 RepID=UPI0026478C11|nr:uncharacterized protein LOC131210130 [Anopheles bellator]
METRLILKPVKMDGLAMKQKQCTPFIKVILRQQHSDPLRMIIENTGAKQIVPKPDDPSVLFVRYPDSSLAEIAKKQLLGLPQVKAATYMRNWYSYSHDEPANNICGSVGPASPQRQPPQPASFANVRPLLETSPTFLRCVYCSAYPVLFQCGCCGAFYCNIQCQKRHYQTHKHSCLMPPLVVMPNYDSIDLLEKIQPKIGLPHLSVNTQQPTSGTKPKGLINAKATPSPQPINGAPSGRVIKGEARTQKADEPPKTKLQRAGFPAVGATVKISYVGKNELYIYDARPGPNGAPNSYEKLIQRCVKAGRKKGQPVVNPPALNDILLAPFGGEYYRAVINSVEGNYADVFFIDFGNSEKLEWSQFREILEPDLKSADRTAHEVWIVNVSKFTERIRQKLNELKAEEFGLSKVIDMSNTSVKLVDLRHPKESYYLGDKLRQLLEKNEEICKSPQMKNIVVAPAPETYVPVLDDEVIESAIPAEDGVELIIIDASFLNQDSMNQIAVVIKANQEKYGELMTEICCYGESDANEYDPKQCGELCLVRYGSIWTRAMLTDIQRGFSEYVLLDLGFLCSVPSKNVRRFPPKLSRTLYVTDCIVDNPETLFTLAKVSAPENLRNKLIKVNVKPEQRDSNASQHVIVISVADTFSS